MFTKPQLLDSFPDVSGVRACMRTWLDCLSPPLPAFCRCHPAPTAPLVPTELPLLSIELGLILILLSVAQFTALFMENMGAQMFVEKCGTH